MLREHAREGIFSDPAHGGNRDKVGWKILGHPGVWLEHSAEENLAVEPVTKDGEVLSLADAKFTSSDAAGEPVGGSPATIRKRARSLRRARLTSCSWASAPWVL